MGKRADSAAATRAAILAGLADGPMRLMQVVDRLYPDLSGQARRRAHSNVDFHLRHLGAMGLIHDRLTLAGTRIYILGPDTRDPSDVYDRDYVIERQATPDGEIVRFGGRWRAGHAQGARRSPVQGYSSLYTEVGL